MRPLEAMTRTLWVVGLMFVPIIFLWNHLYQWAKYPTAAATAGSSQESLDLA